MENTSLSTLQAAMNGNGAPNLKAMANKFATGSNYHGVAHPSLPNYVAMTSGDTQGIACDCKAGQGQGACNGFTCNLFLGSCSCDQPAAHIGDQLETAQKTWAAFGDAMGAPCNLTDGATYAVRHVPFLYYDNVQTNAARCNSHVVDLSTLNMASPPDFTFIAPDLVHDMHDPFPAGAQNITNGDTWIGPEVTAITTSAAYLAGGLLVVVWDEDDASGGIGGSDDPIEIFVMSLYAKAGGYVSAPKANHYSLLATIEDGLDLPRLGKAGMVKPGIADTLADYFPAN
jgi:phosphatidylinositol-3-phosphatase